MNTNTLKWILFTLWSTSIAWLYYTQNKQHLELIFSLGETMNWWAYAMFILLILAIYALYKFFIQKDEYYVKWNFWSIVWGFFTMLFVTTFTYAMLQEASPLYSPSGLLLFFQCIKFLLYPIFLVFLWRALWYTVLRFWDNWKGYDRRFSIPVETAIWLWIFSFGLFVAWVFHMYTTVGLVIVLAILTAVSYPGFIETYKDIKNRTILFQDTEKFSSRVISAEIAFIVLSFVASVSFINIIRPMPIGWDDLGVYMNFPKIMADTWSLLPGAAMYIWHIITGSGFLIGNISTQAFFVNQIGGILATITIVSSLSLIIEKLWYRHEDLTPIDTTSSHLNASKKHKHLIDIDTTNRWLLAGLSSLLYGNTLHDTYSDNHTHSKDKENIQSHHKNHILICIPMILGIIYYVMPMTVFQQAKDMKLDPALMFVSITAVMSLIYALKALMSEEQNKQTATALFVLSGILTGLAFGIKFTTLMLIVASLSCISYMILWSVWVIGFLGVFISIFTLWKLWGQLFIWMPENTLPVVVFGIILAITWYGYAFYTNKNTLRPYVASVILFITWILIALSPWFIKNLSEVGMKNFSINWMLSGSGGGLQTNMNAIYSPEELIQKNKIAVSSTTTSSWQSLNEDFSRYFWQETGLNNYLKLPANLTFQKNQWGEFTDITYIFLALSPVALLFYKRRRHQSKLWIWGITLYLIFGWWILVSVILWNNFWFGIWNILANTPLIWVYLFLIALILSFIILADTNLEKYHFEDRARIWLLVLTAVYGLIFWVSAFWIVWYWVLIYFLLIATIGIGSSYFTYLYGDEREDEKIFKISLTIIFSIVVGIYLLISAPTHAWKNMVTASYNEYKFGTFDQDTAVFLYKNEYFTPLSTLNLANRDILNAEIRKNIESSPTLSSVYSKVPEEMKGSLDFQNEFLSSIMRNTFLKWNISGNELAARQDSLKILSKLYKWVLHPEVSNTNTGAIYRIGTFMTYFIQNNRSRYYEDSLINNFQTYFFEKDADTTVNKMKSVGLKYLLVDLNAATIDRDQRHDLTKRFENLLLTMRSKNLTLVDTDNICLRVAIDAYKNQKITSDRQFLNIAWTNYVSYEDESWNAATVSPQSKRINCANYIVSLIKEQDTLTKYPYLATMAKAISEAKNQQELSNALTPVLSQSWFALFSIE